MSGILVAATYAAAAAPTDDTVNIAASHTAGRALRRAMRAPAADPIASPAMNAAAIVANAYVVGPITSASSRVHATSYTSAANPDSAAAAHASSGDGERASTFNPPSLPRARRELRRGRLRVTAETVVCAGASGVSRDSHRAPAAATTFSVTPTYVVARRPTAGIRKNPAATAPPAAPAVFAAYRIPVSAA